MSLFPFSTSVPYLSPFWHCTCGIFSRFASFLPPFFFSWDPHFGLFLFTLFSLVVLFFCHSPPPPLFRSLLAFRWFSRGLPLFIFVVLFRLFCCLTFVRLSFTSLSSPFSTSLSRHYTTTMPTHYPLTSPARFHSLISTTVGSPHLAITYFN